ncbi:hypothetical protein [Roseateles flavus]|uniref:Uncharacterized protein n=1 Tax=Roseateles flavus TaxID=3149041 RepID=A0ABV0G946_9BURK
MPSTNQRQAQLAEAVQDGTSHLEAVVQSTMPGMGQIVLGTLCLRGTELALSTPALGELTLGGSLVPLGAEHVGRQVAMSLMSAQSALVLGLVWDQMPASVQVKDLRVDGEHHVIEAQESIELRCGEAAILLLADGRIQLRGTYITSHASATQRIVGGSVHVN